MTIKIGSDGKFSGDYGNGKYGVKGDVKKISKNMFSFKGHFTQFCGLTDRTFDVKLDLTSRTATGQNFKKNVKQSTWFWKNGKW